MGLGNGRPSGRLLSFGLCCGLCFLHRFLAFRRHVNGLLQLRRTWYVRYQVWTALEANHLSQNCYRKSEGLFYNPFDQIVILRVNSTKSGGPAEAPPSPKFGKRLEKCFETEGGLFHPLIISSPVSQKRRAHLMFVFIPQSVAMINPKIPQCFASLQSFAPRYPAM